MIFQSLEFTGVSPFKDCFIHGLIRDSEGRKMSKSLGNGVDPQDVIDAYGADSLRYYISTNCSPGLDMRYEAEKVESSWNYINKIWNISRFVLMNTEGMSPEDCHLVPEHFRFADKWIIHRMNRMLDQADGFFDRYEFGEAARVIYNFTWDDFAAWYLEMSKLDLDEPETKKILILVLRTILKLLHPFMPFVTEEIYQQLPKEADSIMIASWPTNNQLLYPDTEDKDWFFELIRKLRQVRNEYNVPYTKPMDIFFRATPDSKAFIQANRHYLDKFINPGIVEYIDEKPMDTLHLSLVFQSLEAYLPLGNLIDLNAERMRLESEIAKLQQEISRSESLLHNEKFRQKAPESKLREETEKYELYQKRLSAAMARIEELKR
jgi:valyl-tRNA synthetase